MKKSIALLCVLIIVFVVGVYNYVSNQKLINELSDNQTTLTNELNSERIVFTGKLNKLQVEYDSLLSKQYDIKLNEPTYKQVKDGLSELKGIKIEGNCIDLSKYVQNYFFDRGLQCYIVISNYQSKNGHMSVVFNCKDKGWVFVEPNGMLELPVVVGKPYYAGGAVFDTGYITAEQFVNSMTIIQSEVLR
jgi:transcriptional antiterminator